MTAIASTTIMRIRVPLTSSTDDDGKRVRWWADGGYVENHLVTLKEELDLEVLDRGEGTELTGGPYSTYCSGLAATG